MVAFREKELDVEKKRELQSVYELPPVIAALLSQRSEPDKIHYFFESRIQDLHSPFEFSSMNKCIERLGKAVESREPVYIFGDRDADGLTSVCMLREFLLKKGLKVFAFVPTGDDNYGFSDSNYDEACKAGVRLVISVDTGITKKKEIEYGKGLGIETIVIDHHTVCEDNYPSCIVVDPKDPRSGYPFPGLSAAGVVAKVIWAYEFSQLKPLYDKEYCLLVAEKQAGGKYRIDIAVMKNFVIERRDHIEQVGQDAAIALLSAENRNYFIFKMTDDYRPFLKNNIRLTALYDKIQRYVPFVKDRKLDELKRKYCRYSRNATDIDAFVFLFKTCVLRSNSAISDKWLSYLDLAAVSAIADLMPLCDENLVLVRLGLAVLNRRQRLNLAGILSQRILVGHDISSADVGYYVAPVLNAAGRLGQTEVALNMLTASDNDSIDIYTRELLHLNEKRRQLCSKLFYDNQDQIRKSWMKNGKKIIVIASPDIPHGFSGLIASNIKNEYGSSVVVVSTAGDEYRGSIRSVTGFDSMDFLSSVGAGFFSDFGGHKFAAGFSLKSKDGLEPFIAAIESRISMMDSADTDDSAEVDLKIDASELDAGFAESVFSLSPFGECNSMPVFMITNLTVCHADKIIGHEFPHLKLVFCNDKGFSMPAILWKRGNEVSDYKEGDKVDIIATVEQSFYNMNKEFRFNIVDIEKKHSALHIE